MPSSELTRGRRTPRRHLDGNLGYVVVKVLVENGLPGITGGLQNFIVCYGDAIEAFGCPQFPWDPESGVDAPRGDGLVGPGDSTKTTILDAIEWVLFPRWALPVSEADFFGADPQEEIVIEATVGDIPEVLLS